MSIMYFEVKQKVFAISVTLSAGLFYSATCSKLNGLRNLQAEFVRIKKKVSKNFLIYYLALINRLPATNKKPQSFEIGVLI